MTYISNLYLLGNCRLASAPTLLDVRTFIGSSLLHFVQFPTNHNYIQVRDIVTYHLAPFDLIVFSALPSSSSFPVVDEILMTSHGPSRALRRLIPEVAIEPPGVTIYLNLLYFPLKRIEFLVAQVVMPHCEEHAASEKKYTLGHGAGEYKYLGCQGGGQCR